MVDWLHKSVKKSPILHPSWCLCPLQSDFTTPPEMEFWVHATSKAGFGQQNGMEVTKPHDVSFCMLLLSVLEFWHCHVNKPGLACWVMEDMWLYHPIALADNRPTLRLVNEIFLDHQTLLANHRCMSKSGQDRLRQHRSKEPSSHPLELSVIIHSGRVEPLHVG